MKNLEEELAFAIQILDGFYVAEGGASKNAFVFDEAIKGLRRIQEYGYDTAFGEKYARRRSEQASDIRTIPIIVGTP